MAAALPESGVCCDPVCDETTIVNIPGPEGDPGVATDGVDGENAYTMLTAPFTMPAELGSGNAAVASTAWIATNQTLSLNGSFLQATAIVNATTVTLKNLEDAGTTAYSTNAAPGTIFAINAKLSPAGIQGPNGVAAAGGLLAANNLSDVADAATSRTNLGLGTMATQAASAVAITGGSVVGIIDLALADGGTGASTAAGARTNLGLVIGTDIQAQDATLLSIAALGTVADRIAYTTGVDTWAETAITAAGRALIDDTDAAAQRATLLVLPRYGLLGSIIGADFNSTGDQAINIHTGITRYVIRRIVVDNASINLTTAAGGIYTAVGKGGIVIVAAAQVYSALTAASKYKDLTLEAVVGTDVFGTTPIYLSLTTGQGAAATANLWVYGENLTP